MVRVLEDMPSADGFPRLSWEQQVPTGQSLHGAEQWMALRISIVVMIFVFAAVYSASESPIGAGMAALAVGGALLAGDQMFKGGITVWETHIKGPPERSAASMEAERRARATPMMRTEYREAMVLPHPDGNVLYFHLFRRSEPGGTLEGITGVPLDSIHAFQIGMFDEWFEDVAQAELRRLNAAPNSYVIVAPTLGHGVVLVAESGGARAAIAALHGYLTKRFILDAPEMQLRWRLKLEEAEQQRQEGKPGH